MLQDLVITVVICFFLKKVIDAVRIELVARIRVRRIRDLVHTAEAWKAKGDPNWKKAVEILETHYGQTPEAERHFYQQVSDLTKWTYDQFYPRKKQ